MRVVGNANNHHPQQNNFMGNASNANMQIEGAPRVAGIGHGFGT